MSRREIASSSGRATSLVYEPRWTSWAERGATAAGSPWAAGRAIVVSGAAGERAVAGGHLDRAEEMVREQRLAIGAARVAHRGVDGAAAVVAVAPCDRVVGAHRRVARVIGALIDRREDVDAAARVRAEGVPLVDAPPYARQAASCRCASVVHDDARRRRPGGVLAKARADQADVPRPAGEAVRGGMDADEAAAATDVTLERTPVILSRDRHPGRRKEDEGVVAGEVAVGEGALVLGLVDGERVLSAEAADRRDPRRDRVVTEAGRLREHQHAKVRRRRPRAPRAVTGPGHGVH